jgi:hypothetical protein
MPKHATPAVTSKHVRPLLDAMATAYSLRYSIVTLDDADQETRRAISEFAPLVRETCGRRYYFVEEATLRVYASAVAEALSAMRRVEVVSDVHDYDTRTGDGATCLAFQELDSDDAGIFVIRLTRVGPAPVIDRAAPVDLRTGATYGSELDRNAEMERGAFETSRKLWAENN